MLGLNLVLAFNVHGVVDELLTFYIFVFEMVGQLPCHIETPYVIWPPTSGGLYGNLRQDPPHTHTHTHTHTLLLDALWRMNLRAENSTRSLLPKSQLDTTSQLLFYNNVRKLPHKNILAN